MNQPKRVLQIIGIMNRGGAETMIMNLYRNIDKTKLQFDFVVHTNEDGTFDEEIKSLGGRIFHCPKYVITNHFAYKKWWKGFFDEHSTDYIAVHGHIGSTASIYLSVAKKYNLFTIAHSHNTDGKIDLKGYVYKLFTLNTRKVADYFFACSQAAGIDRYGKKIACESNNYKVLNNAVDTSFFAFNQSYRNEIRKEFGIDEDAILVGHIGRFNLQKNHKFLVEIAANTIKNNSNIVFLLVGDGDLRMSIEEQVRAFGVEKNVIFTGVRTDVNKFYSAFDSFLFPSFYEGLPVTLVEAQTNGLNCLVSDTITDEVSITDLINYKSLNDTVDSWSDDIIKLAKLPRIDTINQIISGGYDIKTTSQWLTDFYYCLEKK